VKPVTLYDVAEYAGVSYQTVSRVVNQASHVSAKTREKVEAAFNPRYFIEALNYIETKKVFLNIKNGESPCIVRSEKDAVYLNIIMPMKI